jgi:hypothetical protein
MKILILALFTLNTSFAATLYDLYEGMTSEDQIKREQELIESGLSVEDLKLVEYELNGTDQKVNVNLSTEAKDDPKYSQLFRIGVGYIYPLGPALSLDMITINNLKDRKVFSFSLDLTSTLKFNNGAVNNLLVKPNLYIGRYGTYVGPVYQLIHVYTPYMYGQRNFLFQGYGLNLGQDIKMGRTNLSLNAFSTFGGLNNNPKPFIFVGGGIKLSIPVSKKR